MTRLPTILLALALLCGFSIARGETPRRIRISLQIIEMPHPALTRLFADPDNKLPVHTRALALVKSGDARIVESSIISSNSGTKASLEAIEEFICPTEYEPPSFACGPRPPPDPDSARPIPFHRAQVCPTAYETRNTGLTLEIEPDFDPATRTVSLRIAPEIVELGSLVTWQQYIDRWGDNSVRMPIFKTWRLSSIITLPVGQFRLLGIFSDHNSAPPPAIRQKRLAYVRAEVGGENPETRSQKPEVRSQRSEVRGRTGRTPRSKRTIQ